MQYAVRMHSYMQCQLVSVQPSSSAHLAAHLSSNHFPLAISNAFRAPPPLLALVTALAVRAVLDRAAMTLKSTF